MRLPILIHGDCLEELKRLPDSSIDLVLTDLPYGVTRCVWDVVIPFEQMWSQVSRVAKMHAAVLLFGTEPFSSFLRTSNIGQYRYDWIWVKDSPTNHLNAKRMPMRRTERISVFYQKPCQYHPQFTRKKIKDIRPADRKRKQVPIYGKMGAESVRTLPAELSYPDEMLTFRSCAKSKGKSNHPTEKPVGLLRYLIRTYSQKGEIVLDFTMGSGSTGVAAIEEQRKFIGIELDPEIFVGAQNRIHRAQNSSML